MRLISFEVGNKIHAGAVRGDDVIDLTKQFDVTSTMELIETQGIAALELKIVEASADYSYADVTLGLPITYPRKIYCVGVNYMNRNAEYKDGSDAPKYPSLFVRNPLSFSAHNQDMLIPPESEQLDYEGEICLVIGKQGRRIQQADAMDYVAGLTIMNEGSVRDWVRHGKFNVTPGKNWDRSGGIGPWIETDLSLPGDIIATGPPTGSGARFDPPIWLREGDVVEVEVEGVGTLSNGVSKEVI